MRLLVLTTPALVPAYRLSGTATIACASISEAEAKLRELLDGDFEGVLAVHQPFLDAVPSRLVDEPAHTDSVLVVGLPDGEHPAKAEDRGTRLRRLLREAVGYEIKFERKGDSQ